jgi:hypothetical protein
LTGLKIKVGEDIWLQVFVIEKVETLSGIAV